MEGGPYVGLKTDAIYDWTSFHAECQRAFGFPAFYGRNMDAWIDCMTSLDAPSDGLSQIHCAPGQVVTLQLESAAEFKVRCPEQYSALVECSAFVNFRRLEIGGAAVLALSFNA